MRCGTCAPRSSHWTPGEQPRTSPLKFARSSRVRAVSVTAAELPRNRSRGREMRHLHGQRSEEQPHGRARGGTSSCVVLSKRTFRNQKIHTFLACLSPIVYGEKNEQTTRVEL